MKDEKTIETNKVFRNYSKRHKNIEANKTFQN